MRLDPTRVHLRTQFKNFKTSKYPKLDKFNKTKFYPNPVTYRGPFDAKSNENFVRPHVHFEELSSRIKNMQNSQVTNPSPVHLVWRTMDIEPAKWWDHVV